MLKTVLYYHKIGILQEPKRSSSGYRLYGAEELARMRMIKHVKQLGLVLKQIKEILGDTQSHRHNYGVFRSLFEHFYPFQRGAGCVAAQFAEKRVTL